MEHMEHMEHMEQCAVCSLCSIECAIPRGVPMASVLL